MGIEEDNIRKHTTPAYRAPEMWDLFLKELINEKVDIWALGCLLFRICYFKNAFDGESKLQILNGNYCIPDLPKYGLSITGLIRNMLHASPNTRPDITQVWFHVNEQLPVGLQKSLPDRPPEMQSPDRLEGISKPPNKTSPMPSRSPPLPPSSGESTQNAAQPPSSRAGGGAGHMGAFWSTQHATDSFFAKDVSPAKEENIRRNAHEKLHHMPQDHPSKDFEITFFQKDSGIGFDRPMESKSERTTTFQDETFNTFVAEFDIDKLSTGISNDKSGKEEFLEAELVRLKEQLKQSNLEKTEISSKYEKLSAICRSQRQEIQELKQALAARTPSPNRYASSNQTSPGFQSSATPLGEKIEGTVWELQQGNTNKNSPSLEPKQWQAFTEGPQPQQTSKSVTASNGHQNQQAAQKANEFESWGFGAESFTAVPSPTPRISKPITESKIMESSQATQPAGWAGF